MKTGYPLDFDPRLKKLVDPRQYRKGKILGDIVQPLDVVWEVEMRTIQSKPKDFGDMMCNYSSGSE